jgi:flagellar protein FlaG
VIPSRKAGVAMKIDNIKAEQVDPFRMESPGAGSQIIAQASSNQNAVALQPQKVLQKEKPSAEEIQKNLNTINAQLNTMNKSIEFSIDDKSKDIVVKIVNNDTGEVLTQIPPESVLRMRENLKEMAGLIVKETV